MGGKRQHFIPQFLQEGFASRRTKDKTFTWVFRQDSSPFEANIVNVGVEGQFYTEEDDREVDDRITTAEGSFSMLVHNLRNGETSSLSDPELPKLIAHFETRTRHIRQNFLDIGNFLVSNVFDKIKDDEFFADWAIKKIRNNPEMIRSSLIRELKGQQLSQEFLDLLTELSIQYLVPNIIHLNKFKFGELAETLKPLLMEKLVQGAKSGHIKGLKQDSAPEAKIQIFESLTYKVHVLSGDSLILGDSILIFHIDGPRPYKTFLEKKDELKCVYIPLDSKHMLVGVNKGATPEFNDIREIIARCSLEYFIGTENSMQNQELHEKIGIDAYLLTREEMETMVEDSFKE